MKTLTILGRRWFQKTYGNTYHTATIMIDGRTVHVIPQRYGYDSAYLTSATDWLRDNGYLEGMDERRDTLWGYCDRAGIVLEYHATDVSRERDL